MINNEKTEEIQNNENENNNPEPTNFICYYCKKQISKLNYSIYSCGHIICYICLCRNLILDELKPLENNNKTYIELKCKCDKGEQKISPKDLNNFLNNKNKVTFKINNQSDENNDKDQSKIVDNKSKTDLKNNNLITSVSVTNLNIEAINKIKDGINNKDENNNKSIIKCSVHKFDDVVSYCKSCKIEICQKCIDLGLHKDSKKKQHIVVSLENYFRIRKFRSPNLSSYNLFNNEIEKIKEEFTDFAVKENTAISRKLMEIISDCQKLLDQYKLDFEEEKENINLMFDSLKLIYKVYYEDLENNDSSVSRYKFLKKISKDFKGVNFFSEQTEELDNILKSINQYSSQRHLKYKFNLAHFNFEYLDTLKGHEDAVNALCQIDNGYLASGSSDHSIRLWDIMSKKENLNKTNNIDDNINEYNLFTRKNINKTTKSTKNETSNKFIAILNQHNDSVFTLLNNSNDKLLSGGRDDNIIEWDVNSYSDDPTYTNININNQTKESIYYPKNYQAQAMTLTNIKNNLNFSQYRPLRVVFSKSIYIYSLIKLSNGQYAVSGRDETIKIFDKDLKKIVKILKGHENTVFSLIEFAPDLLISGAADKQIKIWDLKQCKCINTFREHTDEVHCLVKLNHFNDQFASASSDKTIKILRYETIEVSKDKKKKIECIGTLKGHTDAVIGLIQLKDFRLASGSCDFTIRLWDINEMTCNQILEGHTNSVFCLIQVKDGRIISGSADNTIKIWG